MHEHSLLDSLLKRIREVLRREKAARVTGVSVRLGALSHISPEHFREHFVHATRGTELDGATLDVRESHDLDDPHAQNIMLDSIEVE